MRTQINGKDAEWGSAIWRLWNQYIDKLAAESTPKANRGVVAQGFSSANYFTPRRYVNEYDRGDTKEGFTYTTKGLSVGQHIIDGGSPFFVSHPPVPRWARGRR